MHRPLCQAASETEVFIDFYLAAAKLQESTNKVRDLNVYVGQTT
jgi:hypothetical protein